MTRSTGKDTRAQPWVLVLCPWGNLGLTVTRHFSEGQALGAAKKALLLDDRNQTAYIGLMTTAVGTEISGNALTVVTAEALSGGDTWEDHFSPKWPGTGPK